MILDEIESNLNLGLFERAFEMLDNLSECERMHPSTLRALMFYAFRERAYQAAEKIALQLVDIDGAPRISAGLVLHELAKIHCQSGDLTKARELARIAVEADDRQRDSILHDKQLSAGLRVFEPFDPTYPSAL